MATKTGGLKDKKKARVQKIMSSKITNASELKLRNKTKKKMLVSQLKGKKKSPYYP